MGSAFPEETKQVCDGADAILKGPVGLSYEESQQIPVEEQPERGAILPLRARYDTYANFRPVLLPPGMARFARRNSCFDFSVFTSVLVGGDRLLRRRLTRLRPSNLQSMLRANVEIHGGG